jgi:CheY-like chemotaxis protein
MSVDAKVILLIEDSASTRFIYKGILENEGYQILEAENGEAGLKVIEQSHIDLVVLDLLLPGIHGLEVLKCIRSNEKTANLPVLVLTNVRDAESLQNSIKTGANYYAHKGSVPDEHFLKIIDELLMKQKGS